MYIIHYSYTSHERIHTFCAGCSGGLVARGACALLGRRLVQKTDVAARQTFCAVTHFIEYAWTRVAEIKGLKKNTNFI